MFGRAGRSDGEDRVELLPVDGSPFARGGDGAASGSTSTWSEPEDDDRAGARSTRAVALIGAAVAAALVIAAAVTSDDDPGALAQPGTTTTVRSSTTTSTVASTSPPITARSSADPPDTRVVSTLPVSITPGYFLEDAPDGLGPARAYSYDNNEFSGSRPPADVQLWATPEAERAAGSWVLTQTSIAFTFPGLLAGGHRVVIGDRIGLLRAHSDGVLELGVELQRLAVAGDDPASGAFDGAPMGATVLSFGLTEAELIALAASITVDTQEVSTIGTVPARLTNVVHSRSFGAGALLQVGAEFEGTDISMTGYWTPEGDSTDQVTISRSRPPADYASLLPFLLVGGRWETVDGRRYWVGSAPPSQYPGDASSSTSAIHFEDNGAVVSVTTNMDALQLGAVLASMERASRPEWQALLEETRQRDQEPPDGAEWVEPDFDEVASGAQNGIPWNVGVSADSGGWVHVETDRFATLIPVSTESPIQVYTSTTSTVVLATGADLDHVALLRVVVGGEVVQEVTGAMFDDDRIAAAALEFTDLGPFTVEVLDASGRVTASLSN